ncbi:unnamed protein product [Cylindrotheca closterium]|uniref:Phosphatidate cytidylyltransferase n=1 Tax=Cylindrotheca closterium TaxID=2856 RepID=A0AAD2FET7_9STRA|nr:unnamed protein product [Cylindrotheca closterium]
MTEGFQATIQNNGFHKAPIHYYNFIGSEIPSITSNPRFSTRQWASVDENDMAPSSSIEPEPEKKRNTPFYKLPKAACRVYASYVKRLWAETDVAARERVADDKVRGSIRNMQNILLHAKEYAEFDDATYESQNKLLVACEEMLEALPKRETAKEKKQADKEVTTELSIANGETSEAVVPEKKKGQRSILFGALMGLTVALWVFSGSYIFTGVFCSMTILGQLEYYRMVMNTGVYPARRISVIGASSMFLTALFAPDLHQVCLPMFGLWAMVWFLTRRRQFSTIPEIATTFTGMFYLGYVPSFWVRIRLLGATMEPTRIYKLMAPVRAFLNKKFDILIPKSWIHGPITSGSVFIFWSWLSLAFSDVGAYFVGRKFGKTKLGEISPAAGATSPNKSVEGVIGGCVVSAMLSVIGAWVQKWPYFVLTGAIHGAILGLLGLIGDLTASMLKRDAGLKDFGDLIPEHGGILDRVDSFVWTAPYSWLVCQHIIPFLKTTV